MAIETLTDLADADADAFAKEKGLAQIELKQAMKDVTDAQNALSEAAGVLAKLQDLAALKRREIAQATVAADGAALFVELDAIIADTRAKQAEMRDLEAAIAEGQARTSAAQGQAGATESAQKTAEDAKQAAAQRDQDHTMWKHASKVPPLSTLKTDADVTKPGAAATAKDDAENVLDDAKKITVEGQDIFGDIPTELFAKAHERRAKRATGIDRAAKHAKDAEDTLGVGLAGAGLAGQTEQKRIAFERSEAALRDFAINGKERYDRALAQLAEVKTGSRINQDERDRLTSLTADGTTAIGLEAAVVDARDALDAARDDVETATRAALAEDPTRDPADAQAVKDAQAALAAPEGDLQNAETAYTQAARDDLDAWETAVPDATWALFDAYETALETLDDLAATDPAALATQLDNDEKAYVQALAAERANARVVIALTAFTQGRRGRASVASQLAPARLLGALRGDD